MKIRSTLIAFLLLAGLMSVRAQYTINMEQFQLSNYLSVAYNLKLTDICEALDVDTTTFSADFNAVDENNARAWPSGENYITLTSDGGSTNYTQGYHGGFWLTADGKAIDWSSDGSNGCTWCVLPEADPVNNHFTFSFWQIPEKAQVGDEYHCEMVLTYNGKSVTFAINVSIVEKPIVEVETALSKLNILGTIETTVTEEPRTNYNPDKGSMDISAAISELGFDAKTLSENLSDYLYMAWFNKETESKEENLRNTWTANSGFWTGTFYDENTGNETGELIENVDWKVYIESFRLDPVTGVLTFNLGQQPNALKSGMKMWLPMYLIKGDRAYILRVNVNTTDPSPDDEEKPFSNQENVGSMEIVINAWPNNNYKSWTAGVNVDSIAALVGCEKSQLVIRAEAAEGEISLNPTANNGGYWLDKDGYAIGWGAGAYTSFEPNGDKSQLNFMQYPGACQIGDSQKYSLYYLGPQKHFQINVTINIIDEPDFDFSLYQQVEEQMIEFQVIPEEGEWNNDHMVEGIKLTDLVEKLGEGSYTFLAEKLTDSDNVIVSDNYTCSPYPGFWMTGSYLHAHDGQNSFGILYSANDAKFHFVKQPGFNQVGESYSANFYLANPATGKYIKYVLYLEYVDQVISYQNVGTEEIALPLNGPEGDYVETPVDMTKCYAALGCDAEFFAENGVWKVLDAKGKFTTEGYEDEMYGFWFDKDGNPTSEESAKLYSVEFLTAESSDGDKDCFRSSSFDEETHVVRLAAEYDGKRYVFVLTLTSDPTAIGSIMADTSATVGGIYNLAGQRMKSLQKGLNIVDGKKVYVK